MVNKKNIKSRIKNRGMTSPELILAIMMLSTFTGVFVLVTQFIASFFQPLNYEAKEEFINAKKDLTDVLQDHIIINERIDKIIDWFSQPGLERSYFASLACTSLPKEEWDIPNLESNFPNNYQLCIQPAFAEQSYQRLQTMESRPGIYIIYAKPIEGITFNSLPLRRIFCRPKPFCSYRIKL